MRRITTPLLGFALLAVLAAPLGADAQQHRRQPGMYLAPKIGAYIPQADLEDGGFETGLDLDLALGLRLLPNLAIELSGGYLRTTAEGFFDDPDFGVVFGDQTVTIVPLRAALRLSLPTGGIEPYGLVGLGVYFVDAEDEGDLPFEDDATALGFHLGGGILFPVHPSVSLGAEVKYLIAEPEIGGVDLSVDGIELNGVLAFRF